MYISYPIIEPNLYYIVTLDITTGTSVFLYFLRRMMPPEIRGQVIKQCFLTNI